MHSNQLIVRVFLDADCAQYLELPVGPDTTCAHLLQLLRPAGDAPDSGHLVELWRGCERPLQREERLFELLAQWGMHRAEVKFYYQPDTPPSLQAAQPHTARAQGTSRRSGEHRTHGGHRNQRRARSSPTPHRRPRSPPPYPGKSRDERLSALQALAARQKQQLLQQQQALAIREQRLHALRQEEASHAQRMNAENGRMKLLRESVDQQELKLRQLRLLRAQADSQDQESDVLASELAVVKARFHSKEQELAAAVARVESLSAQLRRLQSAGGVRSQASVELDELRQQLLQRTQHNAAQSSALAANRQLLHTRHQEMAAVDRRIHQLRQRLQRKREPQRVERPHEQRVVSSNRERSVNAANVAAVEPYVQRPALELPAADGDVHKLRKKALIETKANGSLHSAQSDRSRSPTVTYGKSYDNNVNPAVVKLGSLPDTSHAEENRSRSTERRVAKHPPPPTAPKPVPCEREASRERANISRETKALRSSRGHQEAFQAMQDTLETVSSGLNFNIAQPKSKFVSTEQQSEKQGQFISESTASNPLHSSSQQPLNTQTKLSSASALQVKSQSVSDADRATSHAPLSQTLPSSAVSAAPLLSTISTCRPGPRGPYAELYSARSQSNISPNYNYAEKKVYESQAFLHNSLNAASDNTSSQFAVTDNEEESPEVPQLPIASLLNLNEVNVNEEESRPSKEHSLISSNDHVLEDLIKLEEDLNKESLSLSRSDSTDQLSDSSDSLPYVKIITTPAESDKAPRGILVRRKENSNESKPKRSLTFNPLALLLDAALEGELELVQKTVQMVENPSAPNDEGITALHNAICADHMDVVRFLVHTGCDVNAPDADGWTPLHCAASCNNLEMVRFLVESGACVFAMTLSDQETAVDKCDEEDEGYDGCSQYLRDVQEKLGVLDDGRVYCLYDYEPQQQDELALTSGSVLRVLRRDDEPHWWWAQHESGSQGYVPRNLLGLNPRLPTKSRGEAAPS